MSLVTRAFNSIILATEAPAFTLIGNNAYGIAVFLNNVGDLNNLTYRFQEASQNSPGAYTDIPGATGTLTPGQVSLTKLVSTQPCVRCMAYSAGGTLMFCGIAQFHANVSNIQPILNV